MNSMLYKVIGLLSFIFFFTTCENVSNAGQKVKELVNTEDTIKSEATSIIETPPSIEEDLVEEKILDYAETMPSFPGGLEGVSEYVSRNMKYPPMAEERGLQGRVIISLVVNKKGKVKDVKLTKGLRDDLGCNEEAIRLVENMPNWSPGINEGKPVNVHFHVPIVFKLQ